MAGAARIAVQEGHFRADLDCEQFAHECQGIGLAFVHASRLMRDPKARVRRPDRVRLAAGRQSCVHRVPFIRRRVQRPASLTLERRLS